MVLHIPTPINQCTIQACASCIHNFTYDKSNRRYTCACQQRHLLSVASKMASPQWRSTATLVHGSNVSMWWTNGWPLLTDQRDRPNYQTPSHGPFWANTGCDKVSVLNNLHKWQTASDKLPYDVPHRRAALIGQTCWPSCLLQLYSANDNMATGLTDMASWHVYLLVTVQLRLNTL